MSLDAIDLAARLRERLATGWTEEKIQALSTATILERLAAFGIHTSTDEFARQARTEHSAIALSETWRRRFRVSARGLDDDFIWMAACVLWERLLPERPSFEMLDDRMQAGYEALEAQQTTRACDLWLAVWDGFKLHLAPAMSRVRDVDAVFEGAQAFFNWCQDLQFELGNAGLDDPRYLHARVRYTREFVAQFHAEDDQSLMGNFLRAEAEALWSLGEPAAAEERFEALTRRYPSFAWGYIGWADCFWQYPPPTPEPKDYARAEALYRRALAVPTLEGRADVLTRLADLSEEQGEAEQAAAWRDQADRERAQTHRPPPAPPGPVVPAHLAPARAAAKLGRNEPCWCGSGLKYKRCHLDADRVRPR